MKKAHTINYVQLKKEMLICLRGHFTQKDISKLLGFKYNQYHKWESNLKWLRWDEFLKILDVLNVAYKDAFSEIFTFHENPKNIDIFLKNLCFELSINEIAKIVGCNDSVARRWLMGKSTPTVEDVFKIMNAQSNNLIAFISRIVDIDSLPILKKISDQSMKQKNVEAEYPYACAIEACLELEEYKVLKTHSNKWIANRILISEKNVEETLDALRKVETVSFIKGKYKLNNTWIAIPGIPLPSAARIDKYWTERCLDRYSGEDGVPWKPENGTNSNIRSFRVAPVSKNTALQIQKLLSKTSKEILRLTNIDSEPKEKVCVYVSHFFEISDIKWKINP